MELTMKYSEILNERDQRTTRVMYHGTTTTNLRSILKNGLLANPPKMTYSRDSDIESSGYDSFGGVYATSDINTAKDAAYTSTRVHGGKPIIITLSYVVNSGGVDEDDITNTMMTLVDEFYGDQTLDDFRELLSQNFNTIRTNLVTAFFNLDKRSYKRFKHTGKPQPSFKFTNAGRDALVEYVTYILRHLSSATSDINSLENYISYEMLEEIRHIPEYDALCRKVLSTVGSVSMHTVRVSRNIGYRGKTRILKIKGMDGTVYYDENNQKVKQTTKNSQLAQAATHYFYGNIKEQYAWGSGTGKKQTMADAFVGFKEYLESENWDDSLTQEDVMQEWETEKRECGLYPTDEYTHNVIQDGDVLRNLRLVGGIYTVK